MTKISAMMITIIFYRKMMARRTRIFLRKNLNF
jgi:hypothetical protein